MRTSILCEFFGPFDRTISRFDCIEFSISKFSIIKLLLQIFYHKTPATKLLPLIFKHKISFYKIFCYKFSSPKFTYTNFYHKISTYNKFQLNVTTAQVAPPTTFSSWSRSTALLNCDPTLSPSQLVQWIRNAERTPKRA
jgi:hypothetical protein